MRRHLTSWLAVAMAVVVGVPTASAQMVNGEGGGEIRLLQEAQTRESSGDLKGAEEVIRTVLEERPTSLSALLALERLLRMQGRVEDLLPAVQTLLEADSTSAIGHQMLLRTYSALDSVDAVRRAGRRWMEAVPDMETPYREIGRVWASRGEHARAVSVLERGRERLGGDALALELGDAYASDGDADAAVREWQRAIGENAEGLRLVRRRLGSLPDGGAEVLPRLIESLTQRSTTPARRRAAVELAIEAGLPDRARSIGQAVAEDLEGEALERFLVEVARRADAVRLPQVAYWAYDRLVERGDPEEDRLAIRSRVAELALEVGDTASARKHYEVIERTYDEGSVERRKAAAIRIQLAARDGNVESALRDLRDFRERYPDAPERDDIAAVLGRALIDAGRADRARTILADADGPRARVLRGRLALRSGDIETARTELLAAAPSLQGTEATDAISLLMLLRRLSPEAGARLARGMDRVLNDQPRRAIGVLTEETDELTDSDRAALLDYAASIATRAGLELHAERMRRTLVETYPDARETPGALLALGRSLGRDPGREEASRRMLERLILEYPRSALVPQARRELHRLERRIPNS